MEDNPWHRVILSRSANFLITSLFGITHLKAISSFYRAYRPSALKEVFDRYGDFSKEKTFSSVVEVIIRFAKLGKKIEEVPMILRGRNRIGRSKMKVVRNTVSYLRIIGRNLAANR